MDLSEGKIVKDDRDVGSSSVRESTGRRNVLSCHMDFVEVARKLYEGKGTRYRENLKDCNESNIQELEAEGVAAFSAGQVEISRENVVDIETLMKKPGKSFQGRFLFCRSVAPAFLGKKGLLTVVEDASQDLVVTLDLHNFLTCESKPVDCGEIVPLGSFLAIKNPRLSADAVTLSGLHAVQVINSADQVELLSKKTADKMFPKVKWSSTFFTFLNGSVIGGRFFWFQFEDKKEEEVAVALSKFGIGAHKDGRFPEAIRWFNLALEYISDNDSAANLLANRAAAFLRLRCFHRALDDCNSALEKNGKHRMAAYRKAKALIGLRKYEDAANFISKMLEEEFKDFGRDKLKQLVEIEETARKLASEITKDSVDVDMVRLLKMKDFPIEDVVDIIEYTGPLECFETEMRGRGLRATADIRPGQLLICSKPFAWVNCSNVPYPESPREGELNNSSMEKQADEMFVRIAYKIAYQPKESGVEFYNLFAGPELGYLDENSGKNQMVDMKRIRDLIPCNSFGHVIKNETGGVTNTCYGIWSLPSMLNHSCSDANALWSDHGDILIVRAIKEIAKGEEVVVSYISQREPFDVRQEYLKHYYFDCRCRLCELDKVDEEKGVAERRSKLLKKLQIFLNKNKGNWKEMNEVVETLESLRESHPTLNACLAIDEVHDVTNSFLKLAQFEKCLDLLEKINKVEKEIGLRRSAVITALEIIRCCVLLKNKRKMRLWIKHLKEELIAAYGSLEPVKVPGPGAELLKDLNNLGVNIC